MGQPDESSSEAAAFRDAAPALREDLAVDFEELFFAPAAGAVPVARTPPRVRIDKFIELAKPCFEVSLVFYNIVIAGDSNAYENRKWNASIVIEKLKLS